MSTLHTCGHKGQLVDLATSSCGLCCGTATGTLLSRGTHDTVAIPCSITDALWSSQKISIFVRLVFLATTSWEETNDDIRISISLLPPVRVPSQ